MYKYTRPESNVVSNILSTIRHMVKHPMFIGTHNEFMTESYDFVWLERINKGAKAILEALGSDMRYEVKEIGETDPAKVFRVEYMSGAISIECFITEGRKKVLAEKYNFDIGSSMDIILKYNLMFLEEVTATEMKNFLENEKEYRRKLSPSERAHIFKCDALKSFDVQTSLDSLYSNRVGAKYVDFLLGEDRSLIGCSEARLTALYKVNNILINILKGHSKEYVNVRIIVRNFADSGTKRPLVVLGNNTVGNGLSIHLRSDVVDGAKDRLISNYISANPNIDHDNEHREMMLEKGLLLRLVECEEAIKHLLRVHKAPSNELVAGKMTDVNFMYDMEENGEVLYNAIKSFHGLYLMEEEHRFFKALQNGAKVMRGALGGGFVLLAFDDRIDTDGTPLPMISINASHRYVNWISIDINAIDQVPNNRYTYDSANRHFVYQSL